MGRPGPGIGPAGSLLALGLSGCVPGPNLAAQDAVHEAGDTYLETIPGTDVSFRMVYAPAGTFVIGSPEGEAGRSDDEGPRRTLTLGAFWIGAHEVTYDEYAVFRFRRLDSEQTAIPGLALDIDAVSRPTPPYEDPAQGMGNAGHPAVGMTQWAALQYARWLSEKTGRLYRLPTEAEWEYACRAGTTTPYAFGEDPAGLDRYSWYEASGGDTHRQVGTKEPNAWGVFDMHGNVAEWTLDEYDPGRYATLEGDQTELSRVPPQRGARHTVRGGAFDDGAPALRCAARLESTPAWQRRDPQLPKSRWWNTDSPHVGFRLVRPAGEMSPEEIRAFWDNVPGGD